MLLTLIAATLYCNIYVAPEIPIFSRPTPTPTKNPESFVNEAESLFKEGKMLQAIDAYEQAIQADPLEKSNYVSLARVQAFAGQYEEAEKSAKMSLIENDDYAMGHAVLGWTYNFLEDYLQAEAEVKKALELDPNNALAHAYYAEILVNKGEFGDLDKAIEESRIAYTLAPNLFEAVRARAYVLYVTGNYQESVDLYKASANLNKNIPDIFLFLGYNYKALEDYDLAVEAFLQANALNPADSIPDLELSRTYASVGDFGKAVQYAESAVSDDPDNPHRYGNLGIMYYENGEFDKAIDALKLVIEGGRTADGISVEGLPLDYGRVAMYYWYYGFSLAKTTPDRCSEAKPVFRQLLKVVPEDAIAVENATFGLGLCGEEVESSSTEDAPTPTP